MNISDFIINNSKTEIEYLNILYKYIIYEFLFEKSHTLAELKNMIINTINKDITIKDEDFLYYLNIEFNSNDGENYSLFDYQKEYCKKTNETISKNISLFSSTEKDLLSVLENDNNFYRKLISSLIISSGSHDITLIKALFMNSVYIADEFKKVYNNFFNYLDQIRTTRNTFFKENYSFEIDVPQVTLYQKKTFSLFGIQKIEDIFEKKYENVFLFFIESPMFYIDNLMLIDLYDFNLSIDKISDFYEKLNDKQKYILNEKILKDDEKMTLQDIGKKFGLSRERIRQINNKLKSKARFLLCEREIKNSEVLYKYYNVKNEKYISSEYFLMGLEDSNLRKLYLSLISFPYYSRIHFDNAYDILFDKKAISYAEIEKNILEELPDIISFEIYSKSSKIEKLMIEKKYRKKEKYYIKKDLQEKDIYLNIIDEYFTDGYRISNNEDFNKLKEKFLDLYGVEPDIYVRYIATILDRSPAHNLCARGTYINTSTYPELDSELRKEILEYIRKSKHFVYYSEIMNKFQMKLLKGNIKNQYILKGILDKTLSKNYKTTRDYIIYGDQKFIWSLIIDFMRKQKGKFNLNDIKYEFPNIDTTIIQGALTNESDQGKLIILYNKEYIYADKTNVEILKPTLKKKIDDLMLKTNSDYITSHKLFADIVLSEDNIFEKVDFEVDNFNLYSIIKLLYPNEYYFNRPLISKNEGKNTILAIHDYLMTLEQFDSTISSNYITKMHLSLAWINNFQDLCDYMSNEFVQVNQNTMIKKNKLIITESDIRMIKKILISYIEKYKEFNLNLLNNFVQFPIIINCQWNVYMIKGFINSFYSDEIEIYKKNDNYYIRRLRYE